MIKQILVPCFRRDGGGVMAFPTKNMTHITLINLALSSKKISEIQTGKYSFYYKFYGKFREHFAHKKVKHAAEFVSKDGVHVNTVEGFWSIVKRTINGTHHWISKKHTQAYLAEPLAPRSEMTVRYNTRHICDASRFAQFVGKVSGVRLKYTTLVAGV